MAGHHRDNGGGLQHVKLLAKPGFVFFCSGQQHPVFSTEKKPVVFPGLASDPAVWNFGIFWCHAGRLLWLKYRLLRNLTACPEGGQGGLPYGSIVRGFPL